ncbi:MAG TPA: hypothetical protein VF120_06405 [Ktedonobacterales bacterium]
MFWSFSTAHRSGDPRRRRRHRVGIALLIGLALAVAACGTSTGGGGHPTPTPKPPTATATPAPFAPWRIVSSPNVEHPVPFPSINGLNAVSALSPTDAWAVGGTFAGAPGPSASLIERWNGTAWQLVATSGPGNLYGVAAVSANDVWAVGRQGGEYDNRYQAYVFTTLIMHWTGSQWSVVPSPNPDLIASYLNSVAAISANNIWAVGYTGRAPGSGDALIEHWDGKVWGVVSSQKPAGATGSVYTAVTRIPGTNQLWAVGYAQYAATGGRTTAYFQPLIERWNGNTWHIVASPALPSDAFSGNLNGVVALSATDAWAVGDYTGNDHTLHPLIAHWDGASWKVATGPAQRGGSLTGVAAVGAHDVRAVGHTTTGDTNNPNTHLLIEQWNGTAWQVAVSPEPSGAEYGALGGVTTDGAGNYWAVGSYRPSDNNSNLTLIARCP